MPLSRRYTPEKPPQEISLFGMDFSYVLPPGVGLIDGFLEIFTNANPPIYAIADFVVMTGNQEIQYNIYDPSNPARRSVALGIIRGRAIYAGLTGGVDGTDYQLRWTVNDTAGNTWCRTGLVLVAQTS
jgi:hypothetical protein